MMKRFWPRILSAFSTLALGLVAGSVARFAPPVPVIKVQPSSGAAEVKVQPSPPPALETPRPSQPTVEIMRPHPVSISPYEIKRLVDENNRAVRRGQTSELDLAPIWNRLWISGDDAGVPHGRCNGNCEAYIMTLELDGKPGREVLLRFHAAVTWEYCYLVFQQQDRTSADWVLLGHIDTFNKWDDPQQKVTAAGTQRWLVLGRTSGYGSGFASYTNDWYEVGKDGVVPVLSYQTHLFLGAGADPVTDREAKVLSVDDRGGITTVVLQVSTSYISYNEEHERIPLWSDKRKATFIKGPWMERFIFDPFGSEITEEELKPEYPSYGDAKPITNEEFLKYNYRELLKIAKERWTRRKDWLIDFLKTCGDSVEKQSLLWTADIYNKCQF